MKSEELRDIAANAKPVDLSFKEFIAYLYVSFKAYAAAAKGKYCVNFKDDPFRSFVVVELTKKLEKKLSSDGLSPKSQWAGGKKYLSKISWE